MSFLTSVENKKFKEKHVSNLISKNKLMKNLKRKLAFSEA